MKIEAITANINNINTQFELQQQSSKDEEILSLKHSLQSVQALSKEAQKLIVMETAKYEHKITSLEEKIRDLSENNIENNIENFSIPFEYSQES